MDFRESFPSRSLSRIAERVLGRTDHCCDCADLRSARAVKVCTSREAAETIKGVDRGATLIRVLAAQKVGRREGHQNR